MDEGKLTKAARLTLIVRILGQLGLRGLGQISVAPGKFTAAMKELVTKLDKLIGRTNFLKGKGRNKVCFLLFSFFAALQVTFTADSAERSKRHFFSK